MNKREQAYVEELKTQLALRWTAPILPDVEPPQSLQDGLSTGYLAFGYDYPPRVEPACSSTIYHGIGSHDKTTSQGARYLYSTKSLALKAFRYEMEQRFAAKLMEVDKMIEEINKEDAL